MKKSVKRVLSLLLATVTTLSMIPDTGFKTIAQAEEGVTLKNPVVAEDPTNHLINYSTGEELLKNTVWDTIYFGTYPQREVIADEEAYKEYRTISSYYYDKDHDVIVDVSLYEQLENATDWNAANNTIINGVKYHRMKQSDSLNIKNPAGQETFDPYYYRWDDEEKWHYFSLDPIKWRVLQVNEDGSVLLMADEVIATKQYHNNGQDVTWEDCTLRTFLNYEFLKTAFTTDEQNAIKRTALTNEDGHGYYKNDDGVYIEYTTDGGNDTTDKIFVLSASEYRNEAYGLLGAGFFDENIENASESVGSFNPTKFATSSTFAKASGCYTEYKYQEFCGGNGGIGGSYYWLRTPGKKQNWAEHSCRYGGEVTRGAANYTVRDGVRPVLVLDATKTDLWTYAGKLSTFANGEIPEETESSTEEETTSEETTAEETTPEETTAEETTPEETTAEETTPEETTAEETTPEETTAEETTPEETTAEETTPEETTAEETTPEETTAEETTAHEHTAAAAVKENVVAATCKTTGSYDEVVYCSECGEEISRTAKTIEKLAHTPGEKVVENEIEATCIKGGSYDEVVYCSVCGEEIERNTVDTEKLEHIPGEAVIDNDVPASCTAEGSYESVVYCTVCNEVVSRQTFAVEKTAHTPGEAKVTERVEATYTAEGYEIKSVCCTVCETVLSSEKTVIAKKQLATPSGLKTANTATGVKITWTAVTDAGTYKVFRKEAGSTASWKGIGTTTGTSFTDTKATAGVTYAYTVRCLSEDGKSYISGYNKTGSTIIYLVQPTVKLTNNTVSTVNVSWSASAGAEGYYIYRKEAGGSFKKIKTITGTSTLSYKDPDAVSGKDYYYTVRAYKGTTLSSYTSSVHMICLGMPAVTVSLYKVSGKTSGVTVKWTKITGAKGYYVYRKTASGSWSKIATISSGSTVSYNDTKAAAGTKYYYTVRAYSGSYLSGYKSSAAITR